MTRHAFHIRIGLARYVHGGIFEGRDVGRELSDETSGQFTFSGNALRKFACIVLDVLNPWIRAGR